MEGGARSHLTGQVDRTWWLICCSTGGGLRRKVRKLLLDMLNLRCQKVIQMALKYTLGVQEEDRIQRDIS